jgi:hypothetical protein
MPRDDNEAKELILAAFESARATGRSDWKSMTAGVLKNRVLQLTGRSFDERAFGHERFSDLLEAMPDVVEIDRTTRPPTVHLVAGLEESPHRLLSASSPMTRIRPDLWHGIVDYSSERPWVWDAKTGVARADGDDDGLPRLPTITQDEMAALRNRYVDEYSVKVSDTEGSEQLRQWAAEGRGAFALRPDIRHTWNGFLKNEVTRRLNVFFDDLGMAMPEDALQARAPSPRRSHADDDLVRLRAVVIEVVRSMTLGELAELPLPAAAVLRSQSRSSKGSR